MSKITYNPEHVLSDLASRDVAVRLAAMKFAAQQACNTRLRRLDWLPNPGAMRPIIAALKDSDSRVARNAVIAVAMITYRFFKAAKAYPNVLFLLKSKDKVTRGWAVSAAGHLRGEESLDDILPLRNDRAANVRDEVIRQCCWLATAAHNSRVPALSSVNRERLRRSGIHALNDRAGVVRGIAASLLRELRDPLSLAALRLARNKEKDRIVVECIDMAIQRITEQ